MTIPTATYIRSIVRLIVMALALASHPRAFAEGASNANNELLAKLKARDQQFDNVHLDYLMRGTNRIEDHSWKFPGRRNARPIERPREYKYVHRDELIVRGDDITRIRNVLEPPADGPIHMMRFSKTTNIGGIRTELNLEDVDSNRGDISSADKKGVGYHSDNYLRMEIEHALGFGFGRRITKIETIETIESGFNVTGRIEYGNFNYPCSLVLDRALVIRRAVIDVPYRRMEVTTKGSQSQDGFIFAETGRIRHFNDDKVIVDYFIIYQEAHFNLTDDRYRELTTIDVPAGVDAIR